MYLGKEVSISQQVNTLVLSLDFDGCTDTPESRDRLIDNIHSYCFANPQYTEIIVIIGSLRQSLFSDLNNAIMNSVHFSGQLLSCSILLSEFVDKLSAKLNAIEDKIRVIAEPLLASDIYNNLEPGTSIRLINQISYQDFIGEHRFQFVPVCDFSGENVSYFTKESFEEWYCINIEFLDDTTKHRFLSSWGVNEEEFDSFAQFMKALPLPSIQVIDKKGKNTVIIQKTGQLSYSAGDLFHFDDIEKCLTLYIMKHYLAIKYAKNFDVLHVDDKIDLLTTMENYFLSNKHAIPRGCTFRKLEWNAYEMEAKYGSKILGTGDINHNYIEDAKVIADICTQCGYSSTQYMPKYIKVKESVSMAAKPQYFDCGGLIIVKPKAVKANPHIMLNLFKDVDGVGEEACDLGLAPLEETVTDVLNPV